MKKAKSSCNDQDVPLLSDEENDEQQKAILNIVGRYVVKYLSASNLKILKTVCKTWKKAASDEEEIRILQVMRLSIEFHCEFWKSTDSCRTKYLRSELTPSFAISSKRLLEISCVYFCQNYITRFHLKFVPSQTGSLFNVCTKDQRLGDIAEELGVRAGDTYDATILIFSVYKSERLTTGLEARFERLRNDGNLRVVRLFTSRIFGRVRGVEGDFSTLIIKLGDSRIRSWHTEINYRSDRKEINEKLKELESKLNFNKNKKYLGFLNSLKCMYIGCDHKQHPCGDSNFMLQSVRTN